MLFLFFFNNHATPYLFPDGMITDKTLGKKAVVFPSPPGVLIFNPMMIFLVLPVNPSV